MNGSSNSRSEQKSPRKIIIRAILNCSLFKNLSVNYFSILEKFGKKKQKDQMSVSREPQKFLLPAIV